MDISHLKTIKKIIAHDNCPDGRASALICHEVLPDAEIEFIQYQTPRHKTIEPEAGVLFVDFTPFAEWEPVTPENKNPPMTEAGKARIQAWVEYGTIVLDHHKGAADLVAMFGDRGVFADEKDNPGVSGAVLAWREVYEPLAGARKGIKKTKEAQSLVVREFAALAGVRDTWQNKDPSWVESGEQAASLMFWPWEKLLATGVKGLAPLLEIGPVLRERDYARDTKTIAEAYTIEFEGKKFMCFEGMHTSDIADRVDVDMVIGWHFLKETDGLKVQFSCRSRGDFSALDFAKAHGGGGHKNAAGFKIPLMPENTAAMLVPYGCVELLLGKYLKPEAFPGLKSTVAQGAAIAAAGVGSTVVPQVTPNGTTVPNGTTEVAAAPPA